MSYYISQRGLLGALSPAILDRRVLTPGPPGRSFRHFFLNCHRTGHCIDRAGELDQHAVGRGLDDTAMILGNRGITTSRRCAFRAARVPTSSAPVRRE
jgi:hypothetical protein